LSATCAVGANAGQRAPDKFVGGALARAGPDWLTEDATVDIAMDLKATGRLVRVGYMLGLRGLFMSALPVSVGERNRSM
jgi:hypothetical protein